MLLMNGTNFEANVTELKMFHFSVRILGIERFCRRRFYALLDLTSMQLQKIQLPALSAGNGPAALGIYA
jgi:hypothetical protein